VLKVANGALRYRPATAAAPAAPTAAPTSGGGGKGKKGGAIPPRSVWVLVNNQPQEVKVTTGETDGTYTEITSGSLKEGDQVILAALSTKAPSTTSSVFSQQQSSPGGKRGSGF